MLVSKERAITTRSNPASAQGAASRTLAEMICSSLDADKAENIVVIDLAGKSSFAEIMVIASGNVARHVGAMADHLTQKIKADGILPQVEGFPACDWVLVDAGDVVVHLFRPEVRAFYNLEKMWGGGELSAPVVAGASVGTEVVGARQVWTPEPSASSAGA